MGVDQVRTKLALLQAKSRGRVLDISAKMVYIHLASSIIYFSYEGGRRAKKIIEICDK